MKYIHRFISENDFVIVQVYDNGYERQVPASRPDYQLWLSEGNTPEVTSYIAPELPSLEDYKSQKKAWLGVESARRCADIDIQRVAGMSEKFTQDVRDSMLARFAFLTRCEITNPLTEAEQSEINYLLSVWQVVGSIQTTELIKKVQVDAAETHAAVDAIIWE